MYLRGRVNLTLMNCVYSESIFFVQNRMYTLWQLAIVFAFFKKYIFNFVYTRNVTFLSFIMEEPGTETDRNDTVCVCIYV